MLEKLYPKYPKNKKTLNINKILINVSKTGSFVNKTYITKIFSIRYGNNNGLLACFLCEKKVLI